ncbi:hypothetical protein BRC94_02325 [Halobacteriales archaeon QS_5_70_17]|nr:MAG: hypothetical protein BRC94_02325 [Halobacteriales archaeon QS_5_70_17]
MSEQRYRSNYALIDVSEHLGPDDDLDVPWAEFVGDESSEYSFSVPVADAVDGYVTVQALDVAAYGHEIVVNGKALSGFDIPPSSGWQCWMDVMAGVDLREGENTIRIRRDPETDDSFVIGSLRVTWREPTE